MSKQPESIFKERVLKDLRALPNCYATKIQQVAIRGTPDILCCLNGRFIALELKRDDTQKLDALQKHELDKISGAGGVALLVTPRTWPAILQKLAFLGKYAASASFYD